MLSRGWEEDCQYCCSFHPRVLQEHAHPDSHEDPEVARLLNETFVCIKVDREERPDIDSAYMEICNRLTGSGGWPLTIIMTPDRKPVSAPVQGAGVEWVISIDGMTCQGCASHIEFELRKIPGVAQARVDFEKRSAIVVASPTVTESDLRRAVERAGYSVSSAEKETSGKGGIQ